MPNVILVLLKGNVHFLTLKSSKNSTIFVFNKLKIKYPLFKHLKKKNK